MNELNDLQRTVTVIPAKPQRSQQAVKRQLRVAAYCRVSTEEEEQQSSYEAQCTYYTDKIMTNPEWTMAGILNRTHLLCQQIRPIRASGMRGMRNPVSKVHMEAKWENQDCLALRKQIGLRYKILPSVPYDG